MNNLLVEIEFSKILTEGQAQTQTGTELLTRYRAHLMNNESTCALVNNFIREASTCTYDNGIVAILEQVTDYVKSNKVRWAIASTCESINNSGSQYNYLNLSASKQAEKLLEMKEEEAIKYIKAGAFKNIMYCESFRTIAKSVFKENPVVVEATHKITHPTSIVEQNGTDLYFEVLGTLYKINEDTEVSTADWNEVSNTFRNVTSLLESNIVTLTDETFCVNYNNNEYQLSLVKESEEEGAATKLHIVKLGKDTERELTLEQLREDNRLILMTANPRFKNQMARVLECIALLAENLNKVVNLDNVSIVESANDKFLIVENGANVFATSISSRKNAAWTINEEAMRAVDFIKSKTGVNLTEQLHDAIQKNIASVSEEEQKKMKEQLHTQTLDEMKKRIEVLTEKFKDDPAKLAVLAKLAEDMQGLSLDNVNESVNILHPGVTNASDSFSLLDDLHSYLKYLRSTVSLTNKQDAIRIYNGFLNYNGVLTQDTKKRLLKKFDLDSFTKLAGFLFTEAPTLLDPDGSYKWEDIKNVLQYNPSKLEQDYKAWKNSPDYVEGFKWSEKDYDPNSLERTIVVYDRRDGRNPETTYGYPFTGHRGKSTQYQTNMIRVDWCYRCGFKPSKKYFDAYTKLAENYEKYGPANYEWDFEDFE